MEDLIIRYGLVAVFAGAIVEGDLVLLLAGVVAHLQLIDFPLVVVAGCAGAIIADSTCYWLGRSGTTWLSRLPIGIAVTPLVNRLLDRLGPTEIVAARLIAGTRVASMFLWGAHKLPFSRFLALDSLGCALWATIFGGIGYVMSSQAQVLMGEAKAVEHWVLIFGVAGVAIVMGVRSIVKRLSRRVRKAT